MTLNQQTNSKSYRRFIVIFAALFVVVSLILIVQLKPSYKTQTLANGATLTFVPCWFAPPRGYNYKITCAYYTSPKEKENQAHRFQLPIVYVQINKNRSPDPIFYISGGPGYSVGLNKSNIYGWFSWLKEMNWQRDIVFFDQRGVGMAKPRLQCPGVNKLNLSYLKQAISAEMELAIWQQFAKRCYQNMREKNIELSLITSNHTVNDILNIMQLLEIKSWNIYAISYGTRVALELMKRKSGYLRTVTLDSVYPQNKHDLLVVPELMHKAFKRLFTNCRLSYFCNKNTPDLETKTWTLIKRFKDKPIYLDVNSSYSHKPIRVFINDYRLAWALFQALYYWDKIQQLPQIIDSAYLGNYNALIPIIRTFADSTLDPLFSMPAFYSIECAERNNNVTEADYKQQVKQYSDVYDYTVHNWKYDICHVWQSNRAPAKFFELTKSDVPTLILNGELDPVTPWYWAKESSKFLSKQYTYIVSGISHAVADSDDCSSKTVKQFLNQPNKRPTLNCQHLWHRVKFKFKPESNFKSDH